MITFIKCLVLLQIVFSNYYFILGRKFKDRNQLLIISFDGLRSSTFEDFLQANPKSIINQFRNDGVKADFMKPAFPSATFPNHFTIVTGLYPESHGIVQNRLYDPIYDQKITLSGGYGYTDKKWWNQSEPIWMTASKQGLKTGCMFWVGCDVPTRTADIWRPYQHNYPYDLRVNDVVTYLSKFEMDLVFLYFDEPDSTGHTYGADAIEYKNKLLLVEELLQNLFEKLKAVNKYDTIDIIIVSDHGMVTLKPNNEILIGNYVNQTYIDANKTEYGVVSNINTLPGYEKIVYNAMKDRIPNIMTFYKHEVPEEYNYRRNARIGSIVAIADEGYQLMDQKPTYKGRGNHGYNNSLESMRAIFLARGPSFKRNSSLAGFDNVNVYSLICYLTRVKCKPNNGTIDKFKSILVDYNMSNVVVTNKLQIFMFLSFLLLKF